MPRPTLLLRLPAPCPESWDAMTPAGPGRHCATCQKTVVDFTHQTDSQILAYFQQATPGRTCGHFRASQVGRPLLPAPAPARPWQGWLAGLLLAALAAPGCQTSTGELAAPPVAVRPPLAAADTGTAASAQANPAASARALPPVPRVARPVSGPAPAMLAPDYGQTLGGAPMVEHLAGNTGAVAPPETLVDGEAALIPGGSRSCPPGAHPAPAPGTH